MVGYNIIATEKGSVWKNGKGVNAVIATAITPTKKCKNQAALHSLTAPTASTASYQREIDCEHSAPYKGVIFNSRFWILNKHIIKSSQIMIGIIVFLVPSCSHW